MDAERFDRLTRRLSAPTGRRRLLRGLGGLVSGGLLGGLGRRGSVEARGANRPTRCVTNRDCRPAARDSCIGGRCRNGACVTIIVDCVPGAVCCGNGRCCSRR